MITQVINKIIDNDIGYSFVKSKIAIISTIVFLTILICSAFAEFVAPYNPFDPVTVSLLDAFTPPVWIDGGSTNFVLGTDQQGRDMLSTMIYGSRISLIVAFASILFAMSLGTFLGVTSGFFGGRYEIIVMRFTDVQLTIPSILMALLVDGIARGFISKSLHNDMAIYVLIFAIGISEWPQFARVTRAATLVEKNKEYISASRIIGLSNFLIMFKHILPNVIGPVIVISAANFAAAILIEAGLSFLGIGAQPPIPSWGGMIKDHYAYIIMDKAYLAIIPGVAIMSLVLAFMLLGNGLRDAFDVKD